MGIGKKILDFLFGKNPQIFDERGRVRHNLPDDKWKNWHARYNDTPEQNWRQHKGKTHKSSPALNR